MPLEVIGVGFGRTGTHSLALALEQIGFGPCYYLSEVAKNENHLQLWTSVANGLSINWHSMFKNYKSSVEWPSIRFLPQIYKAFPNAKYILTLRDPVTWYESASKTIFEALELSIHNPNPERRKHAQFNRRIILDETFNNNYENKQHAINVFTKHNKQVIDLIHSQNLLQYYIQDGWQPLCEFLNVPIPDHLFPRHNARDQFQSSMPEWARRIKEQKQTRTGKND